MDHAHRRSVEDRVSAGMLHMLRRLTSGLALLGAIVWAAPVAAGTVFGTYTDLPLGSSVNLTADGSIDWVKWGVTTTGANWTVISKSGASPLISRTLKPLGTSPPGTSVVLFGFAGPPPDNVLNFNWSDGSPPPTSGTSAVVVTETILPPQFDNPLGLGASMTVLGAAQTRILDVYVQGFNADMLITATMSGGGSDSTVVSPTKHPAGDPTNNFSAGRYRVTFSGVGEILTVSVQTVSPVKPGGVNFPNAGFFAAALRPADHPLALDLNATTFHPGDTMTLTVTLTPAGITGNVDAYIMVRLPDASLLSLQFGPGGVVVVPGVYPIATNFAPFAVSGPVLSAQIPPGLPSATFTWIGELRQTGTANVIPTRDEVPFTLAP